MGEREQSDSEISTHLEGSALAKFALLPGSVVPSYLLPSDTFLEGDKSREEEEVFFSAIGS